MLEPANDLVHHPLEAKPGGKPEHLAPQTALSTHGDTDLRGRDVPLDGQLHVLDGIEVDGGDLAGKDVGPLRVGHQQIAIGIIDPFRIEHGGRRFGGSVLGGQEGALIPGDHGVAPASATAVGDDQAGLIEGVNHLVKGRILALDDDARQIPGEHVSQPKGKISARGIVLEKVVGDERDLVQIPGRLQVVGRYAMLPAKVAVGGVLGVVMGKSIVNGSKLQRFCLCQRDAKEVRRPVQRFLHRGPGAPGGDVLAQPCLESVHVCFKALSGHLVSPLCIVMQVFQRRAWQGRVI